MIDFKIASASGLLLLPTSDDAKGRMKNPQSYGTGETYSQNLEELPQAQKQMRPDEEMSVTHPCRVPLGARGADPSWPPTRALSGRQSEGKTAGLPPPRCPRQPRAAPIPLPAPLTGFLSVNTGNL